MWKVSCIETDMKLYKMTAAKDMMEEWVVPCRCMIWGFHSIGYHVSFTTADCMITWHRAF